MLYKLCAALDDERFDLYIHIDKKTDISAFNIESYALKCSRIYVMQNRVNVRWGDISIVDATLAMYRKAHENENYIRYVTLSGLDFPIRSNDQIYNTLSQEGVEFIKGNPIRGKELHKIRNIYLWKLGKLGGMISRAMKQLKMQKRGELRIHGNLAQIYFAPQWHALSGEFVEYMLDVLQNKAIRKFFRFSYAPDELMIPTILFNNKKYRERAISCDFPENTHYNTKSTLHYLNYEPVIEVFDEKSFGRIMNSGRLFVRKVKTGKSDNLVEMIMSRTHSNI